MRIPPPPQNRLISKFFTSFFTLYPTTTYLFSAFSVFSVATFFSHQSRKFLLLREGGIFPPLAERFFYGFDFYVCCFLSSVVWRLVSGVLCLSSASAATETFCAERKNSIKMNKLCETNPISEKLKMNLTPCSTMTNNKKQRTMNYSKRTQTNPILSAEALAKADKANRRTEKEKVISFGLVDILP